MSNIGPEGTPPEAFLPKVEASTIEEVTNGFTFVYDPMQFVEEGLSFMDTTGNSALADELRSVGTRLAEGTGQPMEYARAIAGAVLVYNSLSAQISIDRIRE